MMTPLAYAETRIVLDDADSGRIFEGIGAVSQGGTSRNMVDYPERQRSEILDYMFKPKFGASLQHLKVEIAGGENGTCGSEPSHVITREELANPKPRSYEFWLMAEARKRNPQVLLDCLPWSYPYWVPHPWSQEAADWFVAFLDVAKKHYGLKMDWVAAAWNEHGANLNWIVKTLRPTMDAHGYADVKLQAPDEDNKSWKIFDDLEKNPEANRVIQAVGYHYPFGLLVMLMRECYRSEGEQGIRRVWIMEEAHEYLGGQTDRRTSDLKEGKPAGVLRDLRKAGGGTCGVVVSQSVQDVAPSVRGNLGTVICLRQGHRQSVREAGAAVNLAAWQEPEIAKLPNHHAVARFSRYGEPVYLVVKDARPLGLGVSPAPSREEAAERSRPILEAIPYVKRREPATTAAGAGGMGATGPVANGRGKGMVGPAADGKGSAGPTAANGGLHPREMKVFARDAERPWELIQDRADALGLDREGEGEARAQLEARGFVAYVGTIGAKNRLFELTARGRAFAGERGLTVAGSGKGSVVHEAIVEYTQRSLGRHSSGGRIPYDRWCTARPAAADAGGRPHPNPGLLPEPAGIRGGRVDEASQARAPGGRGCGSGGFCDRRSGQQAAPGGRAEGPGREEWRQDAGEARPDGLRHDRGS